jgi:predicted Zn-dependent protease
MRRRQIVIFPIIIAGIFMLFQYCSAPTFTNPETGRRSRVGMSEESEKALGLQAFQQVVAESDVVSSGPEVEMVKRVVTRLVNATGETGQNFEWQASVVRSPQANAFCLPGGKMVVYTGILPITQNEAGLAAVMGHEMAHATSRHGAQRVLESNLAQTAMMGAQLSMGNMDPQQRQTLMALLGAGAQVGVLLPFSRKHELEADLVGLRYMARAGYDPREAITFWERMDQAGRGQPPEFVSTHPGHGTRIEQLKAELPKVMAEYERAVQTASR